ncbi:MAG: hypothetical protein ABSB79_11860 [Syntrophales bacterium]
MLLSRTRRIKSGLFIFLLFVLLFAPGIKMAEQVFSGMTYCRAEDPPAVTIQDIQIISSNRTLTVSQSVSNLHVFEGGLSHVEMCEFSNSMVNGIMNLNQATGFGLNQGSVVQLDLLYNNQTPFLLPRTNFLGLMHLDNDSLITDDVDNSTTISGQALRGNGVIVINQIAGNMDNQFTSIGLSVGTQSNSNNQPSQLTVKTTETSGIISTALSNDELKALVASSNNTLIAARQKATASVESGALQDFTGICAVSQIAGNMNQVLNRITININSLP